MVFAVWLLRNLIKMLFHPDCKARIVRLQRSFYLTRRYFIAPLHIRFWKCAGFQAGTKAQRGTNTDLAEATDLRLDSLSPKPVACNQSLAQFSPQRINFSI